MNKEAFKRKLIAILSTDVEGYSRLMGEDEDMTIRTLTDYRNAMSSLIQQYRGRVVDSVGDNLLAEFTSVVDAVKCAVEIQKELNTRNTELPENRKMEYRIGVNLGDVVEDGVRIYGDGVNIAARVEGLAEGGGICISGTVYDQIENKLDLGYEDLGEHSVKNISKPIRVYKIPIEPEIIQQHDEEQSDTLVDLSIPDKPSIAVLPFTNMSGDPEQEYFSDGITEDIITALSRSSWLFVIARNSSFTYRGKAVDVKKIGRELGVRYILEGSVRKAGNRVRVTAQLVEGVTANHIWAEKYDGELHDIFEMQDDITQQVVATLQTQILISAGKNEKTVDRPNIRIWDLLARGWRLWYDLNDESLAKGETIARRALDLDPSSSDAHTLLAGILCHRVVMGYVRDEKTLIEANQLAKRAVALNDRSEWAHNTLGIIYLMFGNHDLARSECERAVELNPNFSLAYGHLGSVFSFSEPEEAIKYSEKAIRLNPLDPSIFFRFSSISIAHYVAGRYDEAVEWGRKAIQRRPDYRGPYLTLVCSLVHLNRLEEAEEVVGHFLAFRPEAKISDVNYMFFKDPTVKEGIKQGLQKVNFPE